MTTTVSCPACGSSEPQDSRFCGSCGQPFTPPAPPQAPSSARPEEPAQATHAPAAISPVTAPPTPVAPRSPSASSSRSSGSGASWAIGGFLIGLGLTVLVAVVVVFGVAAGSKSDSNPRSAESGSSSSPSTPATTRAPGSGSTSSPGSSGGGAAPPTSTPESSTTSTGAGSAAPAGASPVGLSRASSSELDRPGSYDYLASRSSCSQHVFMTDLVKEVGIGIDQQMRSVGTVSTAEEMQLGADYVDQLPDVLGGRLVKSGPLASYLAGVARPLLEHVERKDLTFHFYMLEGTDMENALALPGGYVVVTRPLFDKWAENEAMLAAVLGHEIAHVDNRHPIAVIQYARALGLPEDDEVSQGLVWLAQTPYSSALEEESDRDGADYVHAAGYSVPQAVAMWRARAREEGSSPSPGGSGSSGGDPLGILVDIAVGELEHLVSTHPNAGRRACLLEQKAYDLFSEKPRDAVYVGRENLRRRQPMADRVF